VCRQTKDLTKEKSPGDKILNLFYLKNSQNIVCVKARDAATVGSRYPLTIQDGYRVTQFWIRYPPSPISVRLDIRPKWPVIESLDASISEQKDGRITMVPRYPAGGISYASLSGGRLIFADSLSALPNIRPPRYPPKMARYRVTWCLDIRTKRWADNGGASLSDGRLTGPYCIVLVILHQNDYGIQPMESSLTKMITCFESI